VFGGDKVTTEAKVLPIPEGSVVVVRGVHVGGAEAVADAMRQFARAAGHDRFVVLWLDADADAEVWGPDVDLAEKVRGLLDAPRVVGQRAGGRWAPP
jgi:hypothetical protein